MDDLRPNYKAMITPLPHPGRLLQREFLEPLGLSPTDFAHHIGAEESCIADLLEERRPITIDLALKIAAALGTSEEMWMRGQYLHDLTKAYADGSAKQITRDIEVLAGAAE